MATLTRPASLHYSVVVQEQSTGLVLGGGRRNRTFSSLAGAGLEKNRCLEPLGYPTWLVRVSGRITHGIRGDRERRLGPLVADEAGSFLTGGQAQPDRRTP